MNGQNLIASEQIKNDVASEQIKNDVDNEKEILDAYDKRDCGDFCWLGFFFS